MERLRRKEEEANKDLRKMLMWLLHYCDCNDVPVWEEPSFLRLAEEARDSLRELFSSAKRKEEKALERLPMGKVPKQNVEGF